LLAQPRCQDKKSGQDDQCLDRKWFHVFIS
jgi:hypothetical protein